MSRAFVRSSTCATRFSRGHSIARFLCGVASPMALSSCTRSETCLSARRWSRRTGSARRASGLDPELTNTQPHLVWGGSGGSPRLVAVQRKHRPRIPTDIASPRTVAETPFSSAEPLITLKCSSIGKSNLDLHALLIMPDFLTGDFNGRCRTLVKTPDKALGLARF